MGTSTAWIISRYRFPGSGFFDWALVLPIAIPVYINGFAWAGLLGYTSPVYVWLRSNWGVETGPFLWFNLLSLPGAVFILSVTLYPYVYLAGRSWFSKQSAVFSEASASLGRGPAATFFLTVLPMARPALVAGVTLVLMEVLNEYGLMRYFGVETFTTGIFTAWFAFGSMETSIRLSVYLLIFVFGLIIAERYQRWQMRFHQVGGNFRPVQPIQLQGNKAILAWVVSFLPILLGFVLPVAMLLWWSIQSFSRTVDFHFLVLAKNSLTLAVTSSALVVGLGLLISFSSRTMPTLVTRIMAKVATLGYAIPGAVVAIGIIITLLFVQRAAAQYTTLVVSGTWMALVYAYTVRFMAVGYNSIDSGLTNVSTSIDEASRSLGRSPFQTLRRIILPLINRPILLGLLLVFIDVFKELPITLILRPFNFDTLAIRAFEFAKDERLAEAAPFALTVVLIGLTPVYFLTKMLSQRESDSKNEKKL